MSKLSAESLSKSILDTISEAKNQMAQSAKIREALNGNTLVVAAQKQALDDVGAQLAAAELKQAACIDEKLLPQIEIEIGRLEALLSEKRVAYDRVVRLGNALKIRVSELDAENRIARENLDAIVSIEAQIQADKVFEEMQAALCSFVAVLKKAFALNAAGVNATNLMLAINDISIPNPKQHGLSLLWSGRASLHGKYELLSDSWRDDKEALAIFDRYKAIGETKRQLGHHVPHLQTLKATSTGWTTHGLNGGQPVTQSDVATRI